MTQIALSVDTRAVPGGLYGDGDLEAFVQAWRRAEHELQDRVLSPGTVLPVSLGSGRLEFTVLSPLDPVTVGPDTEFGIVSVIEQHRVHESHRCATCAREGLVRYAPLTCSGGTGDDHGVCDDHARLLPGGMAATCPTHELACTACSAPAVARCPGPNCVAQRAWCAAHLQAHPSDPDTGYCGPCRDQLFPVCGSSTGCPGVGSVPCDFVHSTGRPCGARRCPRHAWRWQVFGPQVLGLGRCESHCSTRTDQPAEVLYQILAACSLAKRPAPTAPSLRHAVIKSTGVQMALRDVVELATAQPDSAPPALRGALRGLVAKSRRRWESRTSTMEADEQRATEALGAWLTEVGEARVAEALTVRNFAPAREARAADGGQDAQEAQNAALYVVCEAKIFPPALRKRAGDVLGFDVRVVS